MAAHAPVLSTPDDSERLRRRAIIAGANALLETEGLDGLTIRAVLKQTGLARRAFYESFAGKDDLVVAVFAETLKEAAAYFGAQMAELPDAFARIRAIVFGLVLGSHSHWGGVGQRRVTAMVREHIRLAETRPAELESALSPLLAVIADVIATGIRAGQLREGDAALRATLIYNLVASTVHIELLMEESGEPASDRRQRLADEIWEFCRRAIAA